MAENIFKKQESRYDFPVSCIYGLTVPGGIFLEKESAQELVFEFIS
jgi:hypothetical protein